MTTILIGQSATQQPLRRFTVAEYQRMDEFGIFHPEERVELIEGVIIDHSNPPNYRLFTVDEFERMVEVGILREDERIELIRGEIVRMAPIGKRHNECVDLLNEIIGEQLRKTVRLRIQGSISLQQRVQPQPDVLVLRRPAESYGTVAATAADVLLLIEVSDRTLDYDRTVKRSLYAQAGIPEYWIVNLNDNRVEIYSQPIGSTYQQARIATPSESITPALLPDLTLQVADIIA